MLTKEKILSLVASKPVDACSMFVPTLENLTRAFGATIASRIMSGIEKRKTEEESTLSESVLHMIFENPGLGREQIREQYPPSLRSEVDAVLSRLENGRQVTTTSNDGQVKYQFRKFRQAREFDESSSAR
jgi:hypothetical protein